MYDSLGKFMNVNQIAVLLCWVVVLMCIDELLCYHCDNYCAYVVCVVSKCVNNSGMAGWQNGRMAEWQNGRMVEWRNGGMAEWE
jgi:hypothetical protein